jgi:hypothetical protein
LSETKQVVCDGCGAQKQKANHWYVLFIKTRGINRELVIREAASAGMRVDVMDACGQSCVHKMVDRYLSSGNLQQAQMSEIHQETT